ncbi:MAG: hypothetical protein HC945_04455 [Nitrosarchaeum sp.]|nr:hypothetical protein [Nitrosarchaeum sp.]
MPSSKEATLRERRRRRIVMIVLLCIFSLIILLLPIQEETRLLEPDIEERVRTEQYEALVTRGDCRKEPGSFNTTWLEWPQNQGTSISPALRITNNGTRETTYDIHFSFYDEEVYPFAAFEGRPYALAEHELGNIAISMKSATRTITLEPGGLELVLIYTEKRNPADTYWAYAHIQPENHTLCTGLENVTEILQRNTTELHRTHTTRQTTRHIPLWKYLLTLIP